MSYNVSAYLSEKEAALRKKLETKRREMKLNPHGWKKQPEKEQQ